ncbi:hypothetical protein TRFO_14847 [Tritrichomonas foetus]|uniref:Uncharacterized protein n=1 Tax=Tritrichomonas foetus TaxID=1144522 RepID=A0A1J4KTT7_9EUKA|nr:hypothetical protein TRFO_14847 [Tritrichomonas foetus]|eukprot:OHT14675.1 hypothetical protein TRFO_14847 [Tritrichomonas foetus]
MDGEGVTPPSPILLSDNFASPPPNASGLSLLNKYSDDLSYYSSYDDSYDSENAIPIEPPPMPPYVEKSTNPRFQKFKPRKNPFPYSTPDDSLFTPTQLNRLVNLALERKKLKLNTQEEYESVIAELSTKRTYYAAKHKYAEAERYQNAIKFVRNSELQMRKNEIKEKASNAFLKKETTFKKTFLEFDQETKIEMDNLKNEIQAQREQMSQRHEDEIEALENLWKSQKKARLYNRPSKTLSTLRRQLNFMLTQCRFDEAKEVQKHIDEQANIEQKQNHEHMQHDFSEALRKLTEKQNEEKRFFEDRAQIRIRTFEQKRQRLRAGFENRARKLNAKKEVVTNPDRVWVSTQNQRIGDDATMRRAPMKPTMKIAKKDIYEKEVVTLELPPLAMPKPKKAKTKRPMKAAKTKPKF